MNKTIKTIHTDIEKFLIELKLSWINDNYQSLVQQSIGKGTSHLELLNELLRGESQQRHQRSTIRRIKSARFPVQKTMDGFKWDWPKEINRDAVEHLFTLSFVKNTNNAVLIGNVGTGKTHIATAIGMKACNKGYKVLFVNTIEAINQLLSAQKKGMLQQELRKYQKPQLLILDEVGYLPIDKKGCDLLFQIISLRYETGSTIVTTNKAYKDWDTIFNNDKTVTSAVLDRLLHHCQTVVIKGSSFRMRKKTKQEE